VPGAILPRDPNNVVGQFADAGGNAAAAQLGDQGEVETGVAITRIISAQPYQVGDTAIWTPAAGKRFRLKRLLITIPGDAYAGSPSLLTMDLRDGNASIGLTFVCFLPSAAPNTPGCIFQTPWIDLGDGYSSAAAGNVLNLNLSATIAGAGNVQVLVAGVEE
jgi:hypothetical protein